MLVVGGGIGVVGLYEVLKGLRKKGVMVKDVVGFEWKKDVF